MSSDAETRLAGERSLLAKLRHLEFSDPEQSVHLVESFVARFPDAPSSPERAWYLARSLVYLERWEDAQKVAKQALAEHPNASWSRDLERHLLRYPLGLTPREH